MSKAHREEANPPKPPGPSSGRGEIALDPSRTAVVCIECQNGVVGSSSILPALAAEASPVIVSIAELLRIARLAGALVVHAPYVGALGGAAKYEVSGPCIAYSDAKSPGSQLANNHSPAH